MRALYCSLFLLSFQALGAPQVAVFKYSNKAPPMPGTEGLMATNRMNTLMYSRPICYGVAVTPNSILTTSTCADRIKRISGVTAWFDKRSYEVDTDRATFKRSSDGQLVLLAIRENIHDQLISSPVRSVTSCDLSRQGLTWISYAPDYDSRKFEVYGRLSEKISSKHQDLTDLKRNLDLMKSGAEVHRRIFDNHLLICEHFKQKQTSIRRDLKLRRKDPPVRRFRELCRDLKRTTFKKNVRSITLGKSWEVKHKGHYIDSFLVDGSPVTSKGGSVLALVSGVHQWEQGSSGKDGTTKKRGIEWKRPIPLCTPAAQEFIKLNIPLRPRGKFSVPRLIEGKLR